LICVAKLGGGIQKKSLCSVQDLFAGSARASQNSMLHSKNNIFFGGGIMELSALSDLELTIISSKLSGDEE